MLGIMHVYVIIHNVQLIGNQQQQINHWFPISGMRRGTNEAQKKPEEYAEMIQEYLNHIQGLRRWENYAESHVGNKDQTMVRFDMSGNSINEIRGEKTIRIARSSGAKRRRASPWPWQQQPMDESYQPSSYSRNPLAGFHTGFMKLS